jgi:hypothetical protein
MPPKKLVLIVVDGMTPAGFERALAGGRAPALSFLAEHGTYRQGTSVFLSRRSGPSSIATGSGRRSTHSAPRVRGIVRTHRRVRFRSPQCGLRGRSMLTRDRN